MVYVLRSDGVYVSFLGMSETTITQMLADQGLTCSFLDGATFLAATKK